MHETELQARLRRAKEALESAQDKENEAVRDLARARDSKRIAKERYENLFLDEERAESLRLKSDYRHTTT
jgi:TorA maturation chaperone TorD